MAAFAGWQNFYVIVGSSTGALIGLQFVVLSLITNTPTARADAEAGGAFATPTIVHFGAVLGLSGILSAPWEGIGIPAASLGVRGTERHSVRRHRHSANASAGRVPARVRGLVIPCSVALRGICNVGCIGIWCPLPSARGSVWRRSGGAAAALHRHSQRLGRRHVPRVCQDQGQQAATLKAASTSLRPLCEVKLCLNHPNPDVRVDSSLFGTSRVGSPFRCPRSTWQLPFHACPQQSTTIQGKGPLR